MQAGGCKRRRLVGDRHGTSAPLGLQGLADVIDDVRIDHRHIAHRQQRVVVYGQATFLARQPFLRAVCAVVDQRIGSVAFARPQVGCEIEMRRPGLGTVVQRFFLVLPFLAARRLRQDHDVAELCARHDEVILAVAADHHRRTFRRAPALRHLVLHRLWLARQPCAVIRHREQFRQSIAQQSFQRIVAVERRQQPLQCRSQHFVVLRLGRITSIAQCGQCRR